MANVDGYPTHNLSLIISIYWTGPGTLISLTRRCRTLVRLSSYTSMTRLMATQRTVLVPCLTKPVQNKVHPLVSCIFTDSVLSPPRAAVGVSLIWRCFPEKSITVKCQMPCNILSQKSISKFLTDIFNNIFHHFLASFSLLCFELLHHRLA